MLDSPYEATNDDSGCGGSRRSSLQHGQPGFEKQFSHSHRALPKDSKNCSKAELLSRSDAFRAQRVSEDQNADPLSGHDCLDQ